MVMIGDGYLTGKRMPRGGVMSILAHMCTEHGFCGLTAASRA